MSTLPDGRRERRMVERCPVDEAAAVRQVVARNQPRPVAHPAIIVDVSTLGAASACRRFPLVPNRMIEIGIDGSWSRARVVWSRIGLDGSASVASSSPRPSSVPPALATWLERHEATVR